MAHHDELLDLAIRLVGLSAPAAAPASTGTPIAVAAVAPIPSVSAATPRPEAESRRATSTAYYALFHLLVNASTTGGVTTVDLRPHVARNFEHRQMLDVCKKYTDGSVDLTGRPIPAELQRIADSFLQLQNARHKADYNVKDSVTPVEAQALVQMARNAFTDWGVVAANPAADIFLTELLVGGIKRR